MAKKLYAYTAEKAARIKDAVRYYETLRNPNPRTPLPNVAGDDRFHAKLTEEGTGDLSGWYKWKKVYFDNATGDFIEYSPTIDSGTEYTARGLNYSSSTGLADGDAEPVVEVTYVGYYDDEPVYLFTTGGGGLFPASGRYKVMQIIDDLVPGTWGADYLRFIESD